MTTSFLYDGQNVIAEYEGGVLVKRYVHGPGSDEPLVEYTGSGTSSKVWLISDSRGSITGHVNGSGTSVATNSYDSYGVPGTSNTGRFQYTGQMYLEEIGLYYYKARFYSADLKRFLQTDPIGYGDGLNMYAYVGGDPMNFTDPSGLRRKCDPNKENCKRRTRPSMDEIISYDTHRGYGSGIVSSSTFGGIIFGGTLGSEVIARGTRRTRPLYPPQHIDDIDLNPSELACAALRGALASQRMYASILNAVGAKLPEGTILGSIGFDYTRYSGGGADVGVYFSTDFSDYGFFSSVQINAGYDIDIGVAVLFTSSTDLNSNFGVSNVHEIGVANADFFFSSRSSSGDGEYYYGLGLSLGTGLGVNANAATITGAKSCVK